MSSHGTLVVFGSGPGIGVHVASEFAKNGFEHFILLARNDARLQEDKAFVANGNPNVKIDTLTVDLSNLSSIPEVFTRIEDLAKHARKEIEVVFFNAARIRASEVLTTPVQEIEEDFRVSNLSLYLISQWTLPKLQALKSHSTSFKPSLLVTNSHLPWAPVPTLLSLSLTKAAQMNMVQSLNSAFAEEGVHVGLVHVEGTVLEENKTLTPVNIARETWGFYSRGEGLGVHIKEE